MRPPFFAFYPADFANDLLVEAMSTLQVGAYMLLLCKAWQADPPASLPDDDQILARLARVDAAVWTEIKRGVLAPFRLGTDGRLHSKRLRQEYDTALRLMKAKRAGGQAGAAKRWGRNGGASVAVDSTPNGSVMGVSLGQHCQGNAIQSQSKREEEDKTPPPPAKPGGVDPLATTQPGGGSEKPKKATSVKVLADVIPIPASLDTTEFREVWAEWLAARSEKGNPVTARAAKMQFKTLAPLGVLRAIGCVEASIANDWTGIFPDRKSGTGDSHGTGSGGGVGRAGRAGAPPGKYDHLDGPAGAAARGPATLPFPTSGEGNAARAG